MGCTRERIRQNNKIIVVRNKFKKISKVLLQKQSFWSLGANGVSALGGLLLFAISSSRLSAADFGIWVLFQIVSGLMDMFRLGFLLPGYLQMSAGQSKQLKSEMFASVQYVFIILTFGQAILCWGLNLLPNINAPWKFFFEFYPWVILSGAGMTLAEWWFQSRTRFQNIFLIRAINRVMIVAVSFIAARNIFSLAYVQIFVNLITSTGVLLIFEIPKFWRHYFNKHQKRLFSFGKFSTLSQLASNLLRSSDTLIISNTIGAAATGVYGAAAKFMEFVELPIRSLGAVLFNHLASLVNADRHEEAIKVAKKRIVANSLKILPIALSLTIFAPMMITKISGPNFSASIPILRTMAIYCLLIPADRVCGLLLEAYRRPDLNLLKVVVMLIINIAGDFAAIYFFNSALMVACSSIFTFLTGIIFGFWLIKKAKPQTETINLRLVIKPS